MTPFEPTVEVVSPDFPCGAEWLANALLEFSVPLWSLWGFDTRDEWLILRFEDWKEDAVRELERVDRFLDLGCSRERLVAAARASDVGILKRLEDAITRSDPDAPQLNRRGQPHEWREVWQAEWNDVFHPRWKPVFSSLGYDVPAGFGNPRPTTVDVERVLEWWKQGVDADDARMRAILGRMLDERSSI